MLDEDDCLACSWRATRAARDSKDLQDVAVGCVDEMFFDWVAFLGDEEFLKNRRRKLITKNAFKRDLSHSLLCFAYRSCQMAQQVTVQSTKSR